MKENKLFYEYSEVLKLFKEKFSNIFFEDLLDILIKKGFFVSFYREKKEYFYYTDVEISEKLLLWNFTHTKEEYDFVGYDGDMFFDFIKLGEGTYLRYAKKESLKKIPAFVKNILYLSIDNYEVGEEIQLELLNTCIVTNNKYVISYITNATYRMHRLNNTKLSNFTNSSTYMGIKKDIRGFLVEAIWPHCKDESIFVDLMCGSGAATNAFVQMSNVYASDAQEFCCLLAQVQGKGFNIEIANTLLEELHRYYLENLRRLQEMFLDELNRESQIFYMDIEKKDAVLKAYIEYIDNVPLFSSTSETPRYILTQIEKRRRNLKETPYCLFSFYFANIYFSLEQCIQIDSIRYAIDQVQDKKKKEWLLGILVIAVSVVASNYGGHFAQPKKIDEKTIKKTIEERKRSVWLEFSKRLIAIATESEKYAHEIMAVRGPWKSALAEIGKMKYSSVVVYLDAPYKREEYSRYYHLLETLVKYDYPSSEYKGRVRSIHNGERFRSEFCSRNVKAVERCFVETIVSILNVAEICAWSYSTNGAVDVMHVIEEVKLLINCNVCIYSTLHRHISQGKIRKTNNVRLQVIEYCIIFKK